MSAEPTASRTRVVIGARGSDLSLAQTRYVARRIEALSDGIQAEIRVIETSGDRIQHTPLHEVGKATGQPSNKGVFTKEIEDALLAGEIDLAVHSYKDLPSQLPDGLMIGAIPERVQAEDALVFPRAKRVQDDPPFVAPDATIATSSVRRTALLRHCFPGVQTEDLRGNVPTRLLKLFRDPSGFQLPNRKQPDAILLARAGLERLRESGFFASRPELQELIDACDIESLPPGLFPSAPAQGALAIECRADDAPIRTLLQKIHDADAARGVDAERRLLAALEGGCHLPLGAHCRPAPAFAQIAGELSQNKTERFPLYELFVFLGSDAADNRRGKSFTLHRRGRDPLALAEQVLDEIRSEPAVAPESPNAAVSRDMHPEADAPGIVLTGKAERIAAVRKARPDLKHRLHEAPLLASPPIWRAGPEDAASLPELEQSLRRWLDAAGFAAAAELPAADAQSGEEATLNQSVCIAVFSASGVAAFAELLHEGRIIDRDGRTFSATRFAALPIAWAVVGDKTAEAVQHCFPGAQIVCSSPDNTGEGLARALLADAERRPHSVLALSAERGREEFYQLLTGKQIECVRLELYRTLATPPDAEFWNRLPERARIILGSPSAVEAYFEGFRLWHRPVAPEEVEDPQTLAREYVERFPRHAFCALGPTTAAAIEERGAVAYAVAARADYEAFVEELAPRLRE